MIDCIIRYENPGKNIGEHTADASFIDKAMEPQNIGLLSCRIMLECPIIALGAPSGTYLPESCLHIELCRHCS